MSATPAVETRQLAKSYRSRGEGTVRALAGIDVAVQPGEVFGLLGRNGAGKTTTVKILMGLVPAYEGSARIFGREAGRCAARTDVGYLSESPTYDAFLTGLETLQYHAALAGVSRGERRARAEVALSRVGLSEAALRRVKSYSKGMLQRLGIGQALVADPRLVILNEPTANLDPMGRHEVREIIMGLKEQGRSVLINSHLLSEVEMTCDRIAILDRGRIVKEGTVRDLTQSGGYVHIGVTEITQHLLDTLSAWLTDVREHGGYIVARINGQEDIYPIPEAVRAAGAQLTYLAMATLTLEDVFMQAVREAEAS